MKKFAIALAFLSLILPACKKDEVPTGPPTQQQPPSPISIVVKVGTFTGQNGYVTEGSCEILRDTTNGVETLRTGSSFRVSGGAGTIGFWLTNSVGAGNLNNTTNKLQVSTISSGFSGVYSFPIPGNNSSAYTHVVAFCEAARINFGFAQLQQP